MKLAINASRARSGGAKAHLLGILSEGDPQSFGIDCIHLWAYRELLNDLPSVPWLVKHAPSTTERSILFQLWWERFRLPVEVRKESCDLLLNVDAGSVCRFEPSVTMSRDMLAFEPGEVHRLGFGKARLRQWFLRRIQCRSLTESTGVIFLTRYAASVIQSDCGCVKRFRIIPHGVGESFRAPVPSGKVLVARPDPLNLLYVSPVWPFKHQWHVVRAVQLLRQQDYRVQLTLVGTGTMPSLRRLYRQIQASDPQCEFINYVGPIPHAQIPLVMSEADIFIFASSCENMPNTLLEAMSMGLPIACSNRGPMPDVLQDGGIFFDPEDPISIARAVKIFANDSTLRSQCARRAHQLSLQYSWRRCADQTFGFLNEFATTAHN